MSDIASLRCQYVTKGYEIGFSFTPTKGKVPILLDWPSLPRETLEQALQWAREGNVGLRCGSVSAPEGKYLVVIDQDAEGDVTSLELPATVTAVSGLGMHYYFYADQSVKNSSGRLGVHLDVRGEGGQVIYPGSMHANGSMYDWLPGMAPGRVPMADLPKAIYPMLSDKVTPKHIPKSSMFRSMKYAQAGLRYECQKVETAPEGTRNDILNTAAFKVGRYVGAGHLCPAEAEQALLVAASKSGLRQHESLRTIQSGITAGRLQPKDFQPKDSSIVELAKQGRPLMCTDMGNAERMWSRWGHEIRYCQAFGKWLVWTGMHWEMDDSGAVVRHAFDTVKHIFSEALAMPTSTDDERDAAKAVTKWAIRSQARARVDAMISLATSLGEIPIHPDRMDKHPFLLNCRNGIVNLQTGQLMSHNPIYYLTKVIPIDFDPKATCPRWEQFLSEITDGNPNMIAYLQRLMGYCLTGDVSEQIFAIFHGSGNNGKSVFLDTILGVMGPYAKPAPTSLIMETKSTHPTDVASLKGIRLVRCSEPEENAVLKTSLIKQLTGDRLITARFMRQDNFEFEATHKIILVTNPKPVIHESTPAIWRRIRLVPFTVSIPKNKQDPHLLETLHTEWPGILAWMVNGCLQWQRQGLETPSEVLVATEDYHDDYDVIGDFVSEACLTGPDMICSVVAMRKAYLEWCDLRQHKFRYPAQRFNEIMEFRGFVRKTARYLGKPCKCWLGIDASIMYVQDKD